MLYVVPKHTYYDLQFKFYFWDSVTPNFLLTYLLLIYLTSSSDHIVTKYLSTNIFPVLDTCLKFLDPCCLCVGSTGGGEERCSPSLSVNLAAGESTDSSESDGSSRIDT